MYIKKFKNNMLTLSEDFVTLGKDVRVSCTLIIMAGNHPSAYAG